MTGLGFGGGMDGTRFPPEKWGWSGFDAVYLERMRPGLCVVNRGHPTVRPAPLDRHARACDDGIRLGWLGVRDLASVVREDGGLHPPYGNAWAVATARFFLASWGLGVESF